MDFKDFDGYNKWLGITKQQFEVLISIHALESSGKETRPRMILSEYARICGKKINSPNLFGILKNLIKQQILLKVGKGRYSVNLAAMKEIMAKKKKEYEVELDGFNSLSSDVSEFFRKSAANRVKPYVEYIAGRKEFWKFINPKLREAKKYYIVAGFPGIAYTDDVSENGAQRGDYLTILKEKCFHKKELQIIYLSPLSLDILRTYVKLRFVDDKTVNSECGHIIDALEKQILDNELLSIYYYENPFGLDVVIPINDGPEEMFMFVRDENQVQVGGIYIRSPEATKNAVNRFNEVCSHAQLLKNDSFGKGLFKKLRSRLNRRKLSG